MNFHEEMSRARTDAAQRSKPKRPDGMIKMEIQKQKRLKCCI
jgi:hypothetical protein